MIQMQSMIILIKDLVLESEGLLERLSNFDSLDIQD